MLGVLEPQNGSIKEWQLPSGRRSRPYGMEVDSNDRLWLVETGPSPNRFVGFDPATEQFIRSTPIPSGAGSVRHMNYHQPSGTIWFGTDANTVGRAIVEPQ
jgi:virginiamycin B lyase